MSEIWDRALAGARRELGRDCVEQWLLPIRLHSMARDLAVLSAPSAFMADFVERNYGQPLLRLLRAELPHLRQVSVTVVKRGDCEMAVPHPDPVIAPVPVAPVPQAGEDPLPSAQLDSRFTFDTFVVGKSNELAFSASRRVAETADGSFNPVFLYGGVGLGKTHLMHAIAWQLASTRPDCKVIYLSAERFMNRFVQALRFKDTMTFKEQFRSVDVLMIDDVQFIAGKNSTQEEFFHTFNALIDDKKQIVISADRSPDRIDGMEDRIKSRLQWGLVVDIHPADYELRLGILQAKAAMIAAADPSFRIDPKVLDFLAHRISSNVRVLEGALTRLYAHSELYGGRVIDLDMTHESLSDLLRSHDRKVTLDEIKRKVSEHYRLRMSDLVSERRARAVARPRQVGMYLAKLITSKSLPQIGDAFGKRDHTTVIHAVRRIEALMDTDSQLADDVENLRRMLEG